MRPYRYLFRTGFLCLVFIACQRDWKNPYDDPDYNTPPTAVLTLRRVDDGTERTFVLDAGRCTDREDPGTELKVRWDWDSDGTWDVDWTLTKQDTHTYTEGGQQEVRLSVQDRNGLTDIAIGKLGVSFFITSGLDSFTQVCVGDPSPCAFAEGDSVRWNWEGSGWTAWTAAAPDTQVYTTEGLKNVRLEVKGTNGFYQAYITEVLVDLRPGMKKVPGGSFTMGSDFFYDDLNPEKGDSTNGTYHNELPVHPVTVSSFWMDSTEVTQGGYAALMNHANPSNFKYWGPAAPVERITWFDAVLYCNARSRQHGLDTVYTYAGVTGVPGNGCQLTGVQADLAVRGYRLATEAEWEYAARGGTDTRFFFGDDTTSVGQYAWYVGNAEDQSHPVGLKPGNQYGLYDLNGNLWEWCHDWYARYDSAPADNPSGPATGFMRIARGGGFQNSPITLRSAQRSYNVPYVQEKNIGFRAVLPD